MRPTTVLTLLLALTLTPPAVAADYRTGDIRVQHPWSRALPAVSTVGAAYLEIDNAGGVPDRLLSAASPVAERVELHEHVHAAGMMRMQKAVAVDVPAHGSTRFEPGGMHIMLIGLKRPLNVGDAFPLTLVFERAGALDVQVEVQADAPPAQGAGHAGGHMHAPPAK